MNRFTKISLATAVALSVTACVTPPKPVSKTVGTSITELAMNSVNVIDRKMLEQRKTILGTQYDYGKISIGATGASRTETGTLSVHTTIENMTDYTQTLQGRTRFYDANRTPIEDFSAWQRITLPPRGTGIYREMSLSDKAGFFYIELKEAQ